jgi:hypothetical protein
VHRPGPLYMSYPYRTGPGVSEKVPSRQFVNKGELPILVAPPLPVLGLPYRYELTTKYIVHHND